jgi:hypothetical protein
MSEIQLHHVEFFIDDKHVGSLQRLLAPLGIREFKARPVNNVIASNGGIKAATNGTLQAMFQAEVKKLRLPILKATDVKSILVKIGSNPSNYRYVLTTAVELGFLRKLGKGHSMRYKVAGRK